MQVTGLGKTPGEVGAFFSDTWRTYQKILQHNHMHHRELYDLVRQEFLNASPGLEILDLGCGDASYPAQALKGIPFRSYVGVDLSTVALALAAENFTQFPSRSEFVTANFVDYIQAGTHQFDLILMSFSLHHLTYGDKDQFLGQLSRCLRPGGTFLMIDVFREEGESLADYYERYIGQAHRNQWQLNPEEFVAMSEHITTSDLPDSVPAIMDLGQAHGFKPIDCLFLHPDTTIGLIKFQG